MRVQLRIVRHLPILLYGHKNPVAAESLARSAPPPPRYSASNGADGGGGARRPSNAGGAPAGGTPRGSVNGNTAVASLHGTGAVDGHGMSVSAKLAAPPLAQALMALSASPRLAAQIGSVYFDNERCAARQRESSRGPHALRFLLVLIAFAAHDGI